MENTNLTAYAIQSTEIGEWAKAMLEFHNQLRPIAKDGKSAFNKYTTLDAILDTVRPILYENGLFLMQEIHGQELMTTIFHKSGQYRTSIASMSVMWSSAGGANEIQKFGGSISYYRRYAACAMLGISTKDDDDGQSHPKQQQKTQPSQAKPQQKGPPPPAPRSKHEAIGYPAATTTPSGKPFDQAKSAALAKMKEIISQINPKPEIGTMIMQGIYGVANSKEVATLKTAAIEQGNNWLIGFQHDYSEYREYQRINKESESTEYVQGLIKKSTEIPF